MMMSLGMFVFSLPTLAYQELSRKTDWRWAENARVGARAAQQFLGPGSDKVSLSGTVAPEVAGDRASLDTLREMADQGEAWPLVDGGGKVHGAFTIQSIDEGQTFFTQDGTPRMIRFGIELQRADDTTAGGEVRT